jgi:hypothetical protein
VVVAVTALTAVASPLKPAVSLTVPTPGSAEVQVANAVKFCCVLLSDRVPVAINCKFVAGAMLGGAGGAMVIDATCSVVSVVDPVMPLEVAVITAVPMTAAAAVTRPCKPGELLMVAIPMSDESQTTVEVIFSLLPLE